MDFQIPPGLTELMQDFTVLVLKEKPTDLVDFAANYFTKLKEEKKQYGDKKNTSKGVKFLESFSSDDEEPEPPQHRYDRRKSVCAEAYNPDDDDSDEEQVPVNPKSKAQRERLNQAVKNILLFKSLDLEQLNQVLDAMFERKTVIGDVIIRQGDDGDNFYVVDNGVFDIYVLVDGVDKKVGTYNNKGSFGELALMYNTPRAATIIASSEGTIWGLDRVTFRKILLKAAYQKRKMHEALIENVPMLKFLNEYERMNVADALESKSFKDGELIVKQGDEADNMYFIEKGRVCVKIARQGTNEEVEVTQLSDGQYFGELALVTHNPRAASIYSIGVCRVAALDVLAFERLLGPCMDVMKRNIGDYDEQLSKLGLKNRDLR
ncbi:cAMP-dependent protein kinase type II regulatory subunit isoform X1 [Hydra vulgaris]|uniref:cAMP-dependent protein kinase type II regulatory subunit n=1 Tax=Hydra vulgaris TaxID=6087 RepID=T2MGQ3_HYDVU|nr:cAMP-dependent protein kinase type II regulatory subunit isoform X1 [Hydra vulgaris]